MVLVVELVLQVLDLLHMLRGFGTLLGFRQLDELILNYLDLIPRIFQLLIKFYLLLLAFLQIIL